MHGELRSRLCSLLIFSHGIIEEKVNPLKSLFYKKNFKIKRFLLGKSEKRVPPSSNHCRVSDARVGYLLVFSPLQTPGPDAPPPLIWRSGMRSGSAAAADLASSSSIYLPGYWPQYRPEGDYRDCM